MYYLKMTMLFILCIGIAVLPALVMSDDLVSGDNEVTTWVALSVLAGAVCGFILRSWWVLYSILIGVLLPAVYLYETTDAGGDPWPFGLVAMIYLVVSAAPAMLAAVPGVLYGRHRGAHDY